MDALDRVVRMMNTVWGCGARVLLGLALIGSGASVAGGTPGGRALVLVGLIPLALGLWGQCLVEAVVPRRAA